MKLKNLCYLTEAQVADEVEKGNLNFRYFQGGMYLDPIPYLSPNVSKAVVDERANRWRARGGKARVVRVGDGWKVFFRCVKGMSLEGLT